MRTKRFSGLVVAVVALALVAGGCGSSKSSSSAAPASGGAASSSSAGASPSSGSSSTATSEVHFAKTKFVLHAGLGFGAFHRYIYKPFRAGVFGKPLTHKAALVKAALAGAFTIHELKIAYTDAQSSRVLSKLVSPITALNAKIAALRTQFRAGHYDPAQINSAQSSVMSIGSQSAGARAVIKDQPVPAL